MKTLVISLISLVVVFIISLGFGQDSSPTPQYQDNEFERSVVGQTEDVHCNPLLLDGQPLDYEAFNLESTGELTMVIGDPNNPDSQRIPFSVQLRSNGSVGQISDLKNYRVHTVESLEVSEILANAKGGDMLIITPSLPQYWKAKRIIMVKNSKC